MFETDSEQVLWRKDAKDFEKRVKSAWNCLQGSELDQVTWVILAHGSGIHVSVCVVACLVFQNHCICELNFLRRSHSLSMRVHAFWDLQVDCVQTPSYWSGSSLLFFDSWRSFLATWSRSTRLETRTKESNMCASFRVFNLQAQWKWMLGYVHLQPTVILRVVWVRAQMLGPERWWTMPEKGKARGNSGGGS